MSVGFPAWLKLHDFGLYVEAAFGDMPYLVGSATRSKQWRDVDVRLILDDNVFDAMFGDPKRPQAFSRKWAALCVAFSVLGREMTGLPIDFQIVQRTDANERFPDGERHCLGLLGAYNRVHHPGDVDLGDPHIADLLDKIGADDG